MQGDPCKGCDARGVIRKEIKDNFGFTVTTCSRCNGTRVESGPGKGKRKFFKKSQEQEELSPEEMSIEMQTQAFLRKHGY